MGTRGLGGYLALSLLCFSACADKGLPPGECLSSRDCSEAQACVAGECVGPKTGGCLTDTDCPSGQLCNTESMICVQGPTPCSLHTDCPDHQRCDAAHGICVDGRRPCTSMADCPSSQLCDPTLGVCVECLGQSDCTAPAMCEHGICVGGADAGVGSDGSNAGMCAMDSECGPPMRICESQQCILGCSEFGGLACTSNEVCDTTTGRCVAVSGPCTIDSECSPPQSVCEQGQCVGGCAIPGGIQCVGGLVCDMSTGRCITGGPICRDDSDCMPPSTICNLNTGACDPGCGTTGCTPPNTCNTATGHCQGGSACVDDSFENNDTAATAATIGAGQQPTLGACPGDDDFYALPLTTGQNAAIEIRFVHGEGNLDLEVYDPSGTKIADSTSRSDNEAVTFTATSDGDFVARVFSVQDFGPRPGNQYAMITTVSGGGGNPGQCPADMFEPNNSISAATTLANGQYSQLSSCPNDDDFYAITIGAGETVSIDIVSILLEGLVDGELLDAGGSVVATAGLGLFGSSISYASTTGGTYFLRIELTLDFGSAPGNTYGLAIATQTTGGGSPDAGTGGPGPDAGTGGPGPDAGMGGTGGVCADDSFEENDSQATATMLSYGVHNGFVSCGTDDDFYSFDLSAGDNVSFLIEFVDAEGDIDAELFTASGARLTGAASASNNESFSYDVLSDGTYALHVWLYADRGGYPGNMYNLQVSSCDDDSEEPNNSLATASLAAWSTWYNNLQICLGQDDYYRVDLNQGDNLEFTVNFSSAEGDIDLTLFDPSGSQVATSTSVTGMEQIRHATTSSGSYVVKVFLYGDAGTTPGVEYSMSASR